MIPRNRITLISSSQEFSGSIERIQALGVYNGSSKIQRIEFGSQTSSPYNASSVISHSIEIPNGSFILGPIGRIKGETGDWLIYHR